MQAKLVQMEDPTRKYGTFINSPETLQIIQKMQTGQLVPHVLTYHDGKIYEGDGVADPEGVIRERNVWMNVDAYHRRKVVAAAGDVDGAAKIPAKAIFPSETFRGMLEEYAKISHVLQNSNIPWWAAYSKGVLAAAGPATPTAYETVRRVNYLAEVKGPRYNLGIYNAVNVVTVQNTTDLNVLGFTRSSAKLEGQSEIGDHVTPPTAQNVYASYEKFLYADSFRYEFTMREKRDSQIALEQQVSRDIPGVFAKLKDDKIVAGANAASSTTPTTDWDALLSTYETHYTSDAAKDIEDADNGLQDYGGGMFVLWPRPVARAYRRNVNQTPQLLKPASPGQPESNERNRSWRLPYNEHLTGYIHDGVTAGAAVVISDQWATLFQGPTLEVTYKNQFTPGQVEGRILFDFNGFKEQVSAAASKLLGLLS